MMWLGQSFQGVSCPRLFLFDWGDFRILWTWIFYGWRGTEIIYMGVCFCWLFRLSGQKLIKKPSKKERKKQI